MNVHIILFLPQFSTTCIYKHIFSWINCFQRLTPALHTSPGIVYHSHFLLALRTIQLSPQLLHFPLWHLNRQAIPLTDSYQNFRNTHLTHFRKLLPILTPLTTRSICRYTLNKQLSRSIFTLTHISLDYTSFHSTTRRYTKLYSVKEPPLPSSTLPPSPQPQKP